MDDAITRYEIKTLMDQLQTELKQAPHPSPHFHTKTYYDYAEYVLKVGSQRTLAQLKVRLTELKNTGRIQSDGQIGRSEAKAKRWLAR